MKIEIKSVHSPDISNLKTFVPQDSMNFSFLLELSLGFEGGKGSDIFGIVVCTPRWLEDNCKRGDVIFGRGKLIVYEYDVDLIFERISGYIDSCSVNNWDDAVEKLSKIGIWEFENYREYRK